MFVVTLAIYPRLAAIALFGIIITAALFLKAFVDDVPWVHMDIAGTAWSEESKPYQAKGPSGVAVRTLAALAFEKF